MVTDIFMETIKAKVSKLDNDYKKLFLKNQKIDGCSIIIPIYNQEQELFFCLKYLLKQIFSNKFEVIIIDDNSTKQLDINNISQKPFPDIRIFRLNKNVGAAVARNIGIAKAKYQLLLFLDADMVVPNNFLTYHFRCHKKYNNIISVSFRKHILFNLKNKFYIKRMPNYKFDFRYKKYVPLSWKKDYPFLDNSFFGKTYYMLNSTNNFRTFGNGKQIGIWTLANTVISSSMGIKKKDAIKVGGFDDRFIASGYEDIHFGAKLIANNIKVVPLKNITAFHLIKNSVNKRNHKILATVNNRKLYYRLINDKIKNISKYQFINQINKKYGRYIKQIS